MKHRAIIIDTIRLLIYDKFPNHILTLGYVEETTFTLSESKIILDGKKQLNYDYDADQEDANCQTLYEKLLGCNVPTAFSASFRGSERLANLIKVENAELNDELKLYTRSFYTDEIIFDFIKQYLVTYLGYPPRLDDDGYDEILTEFEGHSLRHLTLFVAITLIDYRRVSAYAQQYFNGTIFADGSGTDINEVTSGDFETVNVNIGSVFSLTEGNGYGSKFPTSDNGTKIGDENFFGDFDSFWYKLFLYMRDKIEQEFQDYTFRKSNGLWNNAKLDKPLNYYSYFDSYPYTQPTRQTRRGISQAGGKIT